MECIWCASAAKELSLYKCGYQNCKHANKILCDKCGNCVHSKITDHTFEKEKKALIFSNQKYDDNTSHTEASTAEQSSKNTKGGINSFKEIENLESAASAFYRTASGAASGANPVIAVGCGINDAYMALNRYNKYEIVDEKGNKDQQELKRQIVKSIAVPTAACTIGKVVAMTGLFNPVTGFIVMGLYGMLGAIVSRKMFDRYWPECSQQRKKLKCIALGLFQFFEEDLENEAVFNKKVIEKRWRKLAKMYHPDRMNGDASKFKELEVYKRIVLSMLPEDECVFPMVAFDENGKVCIDKTTQPKAICIDKKTKETQKSWFSSFNSFW